MNLDHSHLWEDEGATAVIGRTLLNTGDISGWDGRNLIGCPEAKCLNSEGRIVLPPIMFLLTAAGIAVAGDGEVGYRIPHAICGLLALGVLWALCRRVLPNAPRLQFLIVTFAALSPQLLMYFRASRYYAFSVLAMLLSIYAYERWRERKNDCWLFVLAVATVLAFLNHYAIGAAGALSITTTHLIIRKGEITLTDLAKGTIFAIPVLVACVGYCWWIGVIGEGRSEILEFSHDRPYQSPGLMLRLGILLHGVVQADWISWWIGFWFTMFCIEAFRNTSSSMTLSKYPAIFLVCLGLTGITFICIIGELIVRHPVRVGGTLRYSAFALPLILVMKALFIDSLWRENKVVGTVFLMALLLTNIGSFPLTIGANGSFRYDFVSYISEIHRTYADGLYLVRSYLRTHAKTDELVQIMYAPMINEPLVASMGNDLLFCCVVPRGGGKHIQDSAKQDWNDYIWDDTHPDWIISANPNVQNSKLEEYYVLETYLHGSIGFPNPQRPEINWHHSTPPRVENATAVYRRKPLPRPSNHHPPKFNRLIPTHEKTRARK